MQVSIRFALVVAVALLVLVGAVAFLAGRNWEAIKSSPSHANNALPDDGSPQAVTSELQHPTLNSSEKANNLIVGIWAFADGGCGTGYGATYTANGRFSEGDEFSGVEGRWTIRDDILERQNILKYQTNESDGNLSAQPFANVDRFPIVKLTAHNLIIDDKSNRFAYVKCPEGRHIFVDGEIVGGQ